MKLIPLTKGLFAKVDDEDYEEVNKYKWRAVYVGGSVYAKCTINSYSSGNHKTSAIYMHRVILNLKNRLELADHINHDGLDNQKVNLRVCNHSQNAVNTSRLVKKIFPVKWKNKSGKITFYFGASCTKNGKYYRITRKTEHLAIIAHNELALKLHGEFAKLIPVVKI